MGFKNNCKKCGNFCGTNCFRCRVYTGEPTDGDFNIKRDEETPNYKAYEKWLEMVGGVPPEDVTYPDADTEESEKNKKKQDKDLEVIKDKLKDAEKIIRELLYVYQLGKNEMAIARTRQRAEEFLSKLREEAADD